jgi:3D (Asp-Asp-Asp) domain-containing protein
MKVLTIIISLGMAQLAQLALAETYDCPAGQTNALEPGQTIQTSGQPRCDKATGFSEGLCPPGQITGTTYYLPSELNREGWSEYKMFFNCADKGSSTKHTLVNGLSVLICGAPRDTDKPGGCCRPVPSDGAVNVEGTGVTRAGKMIEYTAEVHSSNCPSIFGDPSPISGASHKCLIPFISVACDTSIYAFGTIFEIPMLDKVEIAMPPSGKNKMRHPKYVVCEDTGSAIKGENRFDFYTGTYGLKSKANIFGLTGGELLKMVGNKSCHPNKTFRSIRHSDPEWQTAAGAIAAAIQQSLPTSSKSYWLTEASR